MSLKIELQDVSKRYKTEWILKSVALNLSQGDTLAISGPNGSGKSTLLKILSGYLTPSRGSIQYFNGDTKLSKELVYRYISYTAPYVDLVEELTLQESIDFHQKFKSFYKGLTTKQLIDLLGMKRSRNKEVKNFSSGMKQRLKLALNICSESPLLLLDEPTSNLDQQGIDWYLSLINDYKKDRLVIVASNATVDFDFCQQQLSILNYK